LLRIVSTTMLLLTASGCASIKEPDIKLNPNPHISYEIVAKVLGAPGDLETRSGHVEYQVMNPACVPMTPFSGATLEPRKSLPVAFERIGDGDYAAIVYLDQMQDEDYFGLGECHWSIVAVSADFPHGKMDFSPALYQKHILSGANVPWYFSFKSYENSDDERTDGGDLSKSAYNDPGRTFAITLTATKRP